MSRFLDALHSGRVLLMDGAMGTELQRAGIQEGECYELWNLTHPEKVRAIHQAYVDAGAEVLLTNTFQANLDRLATQGQQGHFAAIHHQGEVLARQAVGPHGFVMADIGSTGCVGGWGAEILAPAGLTADAVLLETFSHQIVFQIAQQLRLTGPHRRPPILISITYTIGVNEEITTVSRLPPEWFGVQATQYGIAALGVNCGRNIGVDEIIEIVRRYRQVTDLPLFARPNAGTPTRVGDCWVYPQTPEQMAARLPELLEAGVSMIGGCCGTTPEHIAAFRRVVDDWNQRQKI